VFRIATASPFAHRIRSLTLIEPVLPTLLCDSDADRRLHARFAQVARDVTEDIWNGSVLEAIDMFTAFWNGSGPQDPVPASARLRMIERADKLVFDLQAALAEENVASAAASLRVPTLLLSGGLSPYLTQRIVQRLGAIVDGAEIRHFPAAGHMLPLTHASTVNAAITRHIARADELAAVPLAVEASMAKAVSLAEG
jgi:pimeloyl-ACP methyl ester carboxylesterase